MNSTKPAIRGILFACNMNSIRSPMAEILARRVIDPKIAVASCGVYEGGQDPFIPQILNEVGLAGETLKPQTFAWIDPQAFDLVIALTPEAADAAKGYFEPEQIEFWDIPNPTDLYGNRDQILDAYRQARDILQKHIKERFIASDKE
ncbi:MAG: arsenate-mycothiol transferase ArsC [bacterium]